LIVYPSPIDFYVITLPYGVYILLQLKIERDAGRVFKGWNEGKIYFAPTYKYSFNSDAYAGETATSKKKRRTPAWYASLLNLVSLRKISLHFLFYSKSPSVKGNIVFFYLTYLLLHPIPLKWLNFLRCDRILWRGDGIVQLSYYRGESRFSDHRPVCGTFAVEVEVLNKKPNRRSSNADMRIDAEELLPTGKGKR
jgi:hypothetical protein